MAGVCKRMNAFDLCFFRTPQRFPYMFTAFLMLNAARHWEYPAKRLQREAFFDIKGSPLLSGVKYDFRSLGHACPAFKRHLRTPELHWARNISLSLLVDSLSSVSVSVCL